MAYLSTDLFPLAPGAAASAFTVSLSGLSVVADDYVLVPISCSATAGTITETSGGSTTWTLQTLYVASGCRMVFAYAKVAAGPTISNPTFTLSAGTGMWQGAVGVVRDADATTFLGGTVATADPGAAATSATTGTMTPSSDNVLLIYFTSLRGNENAAQRFLPIDVVGQVIQNFDDGSAYIGFCAGTVQQTTAAASAKTFYNNRSTRIGSIVIPIKNKASGKLGRHGIGGVTKLAWHGNFGAAHDTDLTWGTPDNGGVTWNGAGLINGIAVNAHVMAVDQTQLGLPPFWGSWTGLAATLNTASAWVGRKATFSAAINMSGKQFSAEYYISLKGSTFGAEGVVFAFRDSTGDWVAFQLANNLNLSAGSFVTAVIALDQATPYASGGTMDWTDVISVTAFFHRAGSAATSRSLFIRNWNLLSASTLLGGNSAVPLDITYLDRVVNGWGFTGICSRLGGAIQPKSSVQVGNGSFATYYDATATLTNFPTVYNSTTQPHTSITANDLEVRILASASDTIIESASATAATVQQNYVIDSSSSTSATYGFTGKSFIGLNPTWKTGVPCSGATFQTCGIIDFKGADIVNATISGGTGTAALSASNGFSSTGSALTASATCLYGIRIAAAGTFDLASTTFSGFTKDIDVTAVTGTVTVNLAVGQATPTHQTAGATVTFVSSPVFQSVTVAGLAVTARIQIYDATSSTQLYLGVPGTASHTWTDSSAAVGSRSIRLRIMRCVGTSADIIVDKLIGTCGTTEAAKAVSYLHDAVADTAYNGNAFDGSTITGIAIIDGTMRLQISSGTIVAYGGVDTLVIDGRKAYAYETYWLSTDAGLVDESRFIIATDGVNLRFVDFKIKNTTSGPVYPVIVNNAYVVDDATGVSASLTDYTGGPIHYAPDHMISNVVTVGGVNIITGDEATILSAIAAQKVPLTLPQFVALK